MHNRNMIWKTKDGRRLKIKDMSYSHLENILKHINKNNDSLIKMYSENTWKFNINQELRLKKLNIIENSDNDELF